MNFVSRLYTHGGDTKHHQLAFSSADWVCYVRWEWRMERTQHISAGPSRWSNTI